jgi:hypothetical protein
MLRVQTQNILYTLTLKMSNHTEKAGRGIFLSLVHNFTIAQKPLFLKTFEDICQALDFEIVFYILVSTQYG